MVKLCDCGCGNPAPIEKRGDKRRNIVKGQPTRFIHGHCGRAGLNIRHGHSVKHKVSPEYGAYTHARGRCCNPHDVAYPNYGGRGIKFLFKSFEEFFDHIGKRPKNKTLDRINNNGHYKKGNIRWATILQQAQNKRQYRRRIEQFSDGQLIQECVRRNLKFS